MTTELTQAPTEAGPGAASGANSDKLASHRRRRRRRKNKGTAPAAVQAQPAQNAAPQPAPQAPPAQPRAAQPKSQPKKKKFFKKDAQPGNAQPGNQMASPSGQVRQQRKVKQQRTPRQFVGPMDHSYRVANGNVADGPPSTIMLANGNAQQDFFAESYNSAAASAAAPVREDAPTRIFCFIEDLFFVAKIHEAAKKLGVKVEFIKGASKEDIARLTDLPEAERPKLLVFDLNNLNAKPLTVIPKFKSKFKRSTSVVGFLNHLQGELKAKAVEAGCDTVMPRSAFSQTLPNMLRRYGIDDEEDQDRQPF